MKHPSGLSSLPKPYIQAICPCLNPYEGEIPCNFFILHFAIWNWEDFDKRIRKRLRLVRLMFQEKMCTTFAQPHRCLVIAFNLQRHFKQSIDLDGCGRFSWCVRCVTLLEQKGYMSRHSVDADTPMLMDDLSWIVLLDKCTHDCACAIVPVPSSMCHCACASSLCHQACAFEPVPLSLCHWSLMLSSFTPAVLCTQQFWYTTILIQATEPVV
jgi:hypothetical protein